MDKREAIQQALSYFEQNPRTASHWTFSNETRHEIIAGLREALAPEAASSSTGTLHVAQEIVAAAEKYPASFVGEDRQEKLALARAVVALSATAPMKEALDLLDDARYELRCASGAIHRAPITETRIKEVTAKISDFLTKNATIDSTAMSERVFQRADSVKGEG